MSFVQALRPYATQSISATTTAQSVTVPGNASIVRVVPGSDGVRVGFGGSPATANSLLVPPGAVEYFSVYPGEVLSFRGESATAVSVAFMGR